MTVLSDKSERHAQAGYAALLEAVASVTANLILGWRWPLLLVFIAATALFGYRAVQIELDAGFEKSIPGDHPYMEVYREFAPHFGGANVVTIALMRKHGDIFDAEFLTRLDQATRSVLAIPGVDQSSVNSLFSPLAVYITVNEVGYEGGRIVRADFKPTLENIAEVRANLLKSNEIGRLVTADMRGALIRAELVEQDPVTGERLDYRAVGRMLTELRGQYETEDTTVHIVGFAKFIYDVIEGTGAVLAFFVVVLFITAVLLYFYVGSMALTLASLFAALAAVIWELGLIELLGYGIDPLSVLVPFLVFSIGVSHAVQMVNAWRAACAAGDDALEAARTAFRRLFIPGTTALLTTATGFGVIMIIDIPIIHELGVTASIGMAVMIVTNKLLLPLLLSYVHLDGAARLRCDRRARSLEAMALWRWLSRCATRPVSVPIILVSVTVMAIGIHQRQHLIVGDAEAGAPELRENSRYNRDMALIVDNFNIGIDELTVMAVTPDYGCTSFPSMYAIDRFHWLMANQPNVESVNSLAREMRIRFAGNSEGHPAYFEIPRNRFSLGGTMRQMELRQKFYNDSCDVIPVRVYSADHKATTLSELTATVETFAETQDSAVDFRLAVGNAGVMAATNEAVQAARHSMLLMLYTVVAVLCLTTFLSWRIALCVLIPLVLVSQFAEAVMAWLGIGLKVSTLPVLALGAGVGVDYGIYLFSRTQAALQRGARLQDAYLESLQNTGTAVVFTAVTLTIGVATWVFSPLKFQADMGLLLAYMFFVNMLGAILLLPALAVWLVGDSAGGPKAQLD